MMEHSYFKDRLSAYFDGELAPPEKTAVREHLETCAECCRRIAELEKLQALIDKHGELAEGAYWEQNAEKIEARLGIAATSVTDIRPEKRGLSVWKWATAVASAVVLTFIGLHQSDILQDEPAIQLPTIPTEADSLVDSQGIDGEGLPELKDMPADGYQMSSPVPADTDGRAVRKAAHETAPRRDKKGEAIDADRSGEFEAAKPSPELPDLQEATQDPNYRPQRKSVPEPAPSEIGAGDRTDATIDEPQRSITAETVELGIDRQVPVRKKETSATDAFSPASGVELFEHQANDSGQTLGFWRDMRDSALALLRPRVEVKALRELTLIDSTRKVHDSLVLSELNLLTACCEIARRSSDSIEVRQALDIVRGISENASSPNREMARSCLQRLGRSESRDSGNFED